MTIVVPCYNDGEHLREAIDSALAQDHPDCEVVIADDGSTDPATIRELGLLEGPDVRVIRCTHAGVSRARNAAVSAATGDYILPLDSDDRLASTFASRASQILDSSADVGIVGAGTEFIGRAPGHFQPEVPHPTSWLVGNQLPVSAVYRKSDWEEVGGYADDLGWAEDWHFWIRLVALGRRVEVLPSVGLYYRRRAGQVTASVPWDVQRATRTRVLMEGLPIIQRYQDEATSLIGDRLNALEERRATPAPLWRRVRQRLRPPARG